MFQSLGSDLLVSTSNDTTEKKTFRRGAGAQMSGILSSCCPFLSNATRGGRGSPPYTAEDVRIRLHNWTNSLSGSTQVPRPVKNSAEDKSGLPEMSAESSAITFVKSETSFVPEEEEGECKVILPAREICPELDQVVAAVVAADFHPIPDGDWETEKGLEEEEVTLLQMKQAGDDELNLTSLERKAATTVLPVKPQASRHVYELSSALPFKIKSASNPPSLPHIPEQPPQSMSIPVFDSTNSTSEEGMSQEISQTSTSTEQPDSAPDTPTERSVESPSAALPPKVPVLTEDPTQASPSAELLDAISSFSEARGAAKSRRSRMTSTRAPTPWSSAELDDDADIAPEQMAEEEEEEELERASSSGSSSPFESVAATTDSSYHTLPTASNSVEKADQVAADRTQEQVTAQTQSVAAAQQEATADVVMEAAGLMSDATEETRAVTPPAAETEETEESNPTAPQGTETSTAAATELEPGTQASSDPSPDPSEEQTAEPQADNSTTGGTNDPEDTTAAGDQPPAVAISDDVSLRYFCGAFQPVDHHMTRYAGLESTAATAPKPLAVPSGRSDSAVTPQGETATDRGRTAASDSRLPPGARSSSPGPLAGDNSGVQLEAKQPSTDIPT